MPGQRFELKVFLFSKAHGHFMNAVQVGGFGGRPLPKLGEETGFMVGSDRLILVDERMEKRIFAGRKDNWHPP